MTELKERVRAAGRVLYNVRAHRAWVAVLLGMAVFTALFWVVVFTGTVRLSPEVEGTADDFSRAVATMYFIVSLVVIPAVVLTVGVLVERRLGHRSRDDAVLAFAGVGLVVAAFPVLMIATSEPEGAAVIPAIWLFGVPVFLASVLARFYLDTVVRSPRLTGLVAGVALLPPIIVLLYLLGLYVARGSGATA